MADGDSKITKIGAGQYLCKEGEKTTYLFFISRGECEILVNDPETGNEVVVGVMGSGSVAGIMSFLEGEPRNASLRAKTDIECTIIKSMQREKLLKTVPIWFKALLKQMAGDLKRVDQNLVKITEEYNMLQKRYKVLKSKVPGEDS